MSYFRLAFLFICFLGTDGLRFNRKPSANDVNQIKTWVLLVAGSNGWYNYRHQADICHAYQIVKAHGIPDANIIVMMYDDIANNSQNNRMGEIINHPDGRDVYKGVLKDYTGKDVNSVNFLKILSGDAAGMRGIGSGKVIKSGKNDRVFVNFVDHGGSGVLCFPYDELTAGQLMKTLTKMHKDQKYAEMVMYIEACESGSMFKNILSHDLNVFVTTAANFNEPSMACYLDDTLETFLGDCYSVNWMEDTDGTDIGKESLYQQYLKVKEETNTSHVELYGSVSFDTLPVADFQGETAARLFAHPTVDRRPAVSHDVPLVLLNHLMARNHRNSSTLNKKYYDIKQTRRTFEKLMWKILRSTADRSEQVDKWLNEKPNSIDDLDCHTEIVRRFSKECLNFGQNPYALKFVYTLTNACNDGVNMERLSLALNKHCSLKRFTDGVI